MSREIIILRQTVSETCPDTACNFLACRSGLSKSSIKDAMKKGAAWLKQKHRKKKRLRRAAFQIKPGNEIELFYNKKLLAIQPVKGVCLADMRHYSIWFKPAGLLTQGTSFGDHCSLMRQAELFFKSGRSVYFCGKIVGTVSAP